ncbi:hypothetical protein FOA52_015612 [Chlamydomonas sp. UWO 241]|nr:hypothetical protein FOA52_015612 [Chlamydomonas sp. UWO 241]
MAALTTVVVGVATFTLGFLARKALDRPRKGKIAVKKKLIKAASPSFALSRPKEELKMVLCVNEALKMGKGKIGAQCAHAAVGVVERYKAKEQLVFKQWSYFGQAKIALKIQDDMEMDALEAKATALGMPTYIVHDAGRTQIPAGAQTVLAIGPAPKSLLDQVTGHLRLL